MDIRGATKEQIIEALETANENYNGNLRFGSALGYGYADIEPLAHSRGDAYKVKLGVESARAPGSRVSPEAPYFGSKPRRIASPCWHANRDFMRALFDLAPDARIRTALTNNQDFADTSEYLGYGRKRQYAGAEHFEEIYQYTNVGIGPPIYGGYPPLADACNCDEGEYPEYATEGLTPGQFQMRRELLGDLARDAGVDTDGARWQRLAWSGNLEKMRKKINKPSPAYMEVS